MGSRGTGVREAAVPNLWHSSIEHRRSATPGTRLRPLEGSSRRVVVDDARLLEKLRAIEALFAGATMPGERVAAIWWTVFAVDANMRSRLRAAFAGTCPNSFDGNWNLPARPGGQL